MPPGNGLGGLARKGAVLVATITRKMRREIPFWVSCPEGSVGPFWTTEAAHNRLSAIKEQEMCAHVHEIVEARVAPVPAWRERLAAEDPDAWAFL